MLTSLQNDKVKLAHALQTRAKARRKEGKIALEGQRLVRDAVERGHIPDFIFYAPGQEQAAAFLRTHHIEPILVSDEVMRHISDTEQPPGVLGVFPMPAPALPPDPRRVLILDSIRDPGNLGTILRTAAAAGVQAALLSPTCADPYNPKTLRGGMGAHFRIPFAAFDWEQIARYCYNHLVYVADSAGDMRYDAADWSKPWALVIGSEAHGVGEPALGMAQARISIPMAAATESLNAAAAAAVILFEAKRQSEA